MGVGQGIDRIITPQGLTGADETVRTRRAKTTARLHKLVRAPRAHFLPWPVGAAIAIPLLLCFVVALAGLAPNASNGKVAAMVIAQALLLAATVTASHRAWHLQHELYSSRRLGDYRLMAPLGGGMSEVWLAWDEPHRREVALKLLRTPGTAEATRMRFAREVELVRSLRAPQMARIYDFGVTDDGFAFIAFEYHRGMDLEALVTAFGALEPERAVHLFAQACRGLAVAHRVGVVHRDVKPANLHCSDRKNEEDSVHILDFGVARPIDEVGVTLDGTVVGTPAYMSPEAFEGSGLTPAADVYSLGAALYFALTGTPPFDGDTASDLRRAHQLAPLVPPSLRAQVELPRTLEKIVLRCLAKDPSTRFQDAAELGAALDHVARLLPSWKRDDAARWWHRARVGRPATPMAPTRERTTEVEVVTRA
jgi:serine/threonine-protein kinase